MGRKPVRGLTGLVLVGVTLVGCESSRPYQGARAPGGSSIGAAAPSTGWNSSTGVAARPATTAPGGTVQQMPASQPYSSTQPYTAPSPAATSRSYNTQGTTTSSGGALPSSPYQTGAGSSLNERPMTNSPAASSGNYNLGRGSSPGSTLSAPSTPSTLSRPATSTLTPPADTGTGSTSRFSAPPTAPVPPTLESPPAYQSPSSLPSRSSTTTPPPAPLPSSSGLSGSSAPDLVPPSPPVR